jgi:hypothetical protein
MPKPAKKFNKIPKPNKPYPNRPFFAHQNEQLPRTIASSA